MDERCGTCRFYENGYCHRFPPTLRATGTYNVEVDEYEWCGEWKKTK